MWEGAVAAFVAASRGVEPARRHGPLRRHAGPDGRPNVALAVGPAALEGALRACAGQEELAQRPAHGLRLLGRPRRPPRQRRRGRGRPRGQAQGAPPRWRGRRRGRGAGSEGPPARRPRCCADFPLAVGEAALPGLFAAGAGLPKLADRATHRRITTWARQRHRRRSAARRHKQRPHRRRIPPREAGRACGGADLVLAVCEGALRALATRTLLPELADGAQNNGIAVIWQRQLLHHIAGHSSDLVLAVREGAHVHLLTARP
mmetsp:Transcript_73805/g.207999  ORF Transcript_73805/g.207999 Transcript_73805/m.207999 type:complete len:261 (-) Transcript_73805:398-1180(-)